MIVGLIQASSQTNKNSILFDAVKEYATGHEVVNFGCLPDDIIKFSYIEISIEIGILLASKANTITPNNDGIAKKIPGQRPYV